MLENKCYKCDTILTPLNSSREHIILNACGGKLKSNLLLCKTCNSNFGDKFDNELAKDINPLSNLLKIKRDRGTPQKVNGLDTLNNIDYFLESSGDISLRKPLIKEIDFENEDISKRRINIQAPNEKILKQTLNGLKRKYPDLNIEKALEEFTYDEKAFDKELKIKMSIGGLKTFKSITKTAINFYMLKGGNRNEIKHLFEYLDGNKDIGIVWFHYPDNEVYKPEKNEVVHIIKIVGKKTEKILYAYVELFSTHCFLIKLNDNYSGKNLDLDYIFNVHSNEVKYELTKLDLNRKELLNLFENKDVNPHSKIQEKTSRVIGIAHNNDLKNEISKSVDKIFSKHNKKVLDNSILQELREDFMRIIKPHINYKK
jgi:hypothetical protein